VPYGVACYDNIINEYGSTWARSFKGYSQSALATLPKVTTETGWWTDGTPEGDDRQGKILLNIYLEQYKMGWRYTCIYEIIDFTDGKDGFYAIRRLVPRRPTSTTSPLFWPTLRVLSERTGSLMRFPASLRQCMTCSCKNPTASSS
jgi:hypothetical protein